MDFIAIGLAATAPAMYLTAMFKSARPTATAFAVLLTALLSGLLVSFLLVLNEGGPLTRRTAGTVGLAGISAAAAAAGVRSADNNADEKREAAKE